MHSGFSDDYDNIGRGVTLGEMNIIGFFQKLGKEGSAMLIDQVP